jgi:hypothetical protein
MRVELRLAVFGTVFVGVMAAVYWFTSYEDAGSTLLLVGALAYALMGGYLYVQYRRLRPGPPRPEDSEEATIRDAEVEVGYFPAASVWPAALGLGAVVTTLGLVFGYWFFVLAAILFVGAIVGYAVEAQARS